MSQQGGWNINQGQVNEHTHVKFENELEIDRRLILESPGKVLKNHIYGDNENIYLLVDRDGDGDTETPSPLRLRHPTEAGWIYGNEIYHQGNLPIESGIFTPFLRTFESDSTPTMGQQTGFYARVGNTCTFTIYIEVLEDWNDTGKVEIHSLPFPANGLPRMNIWHSVIVNDWNNVEINEGEVVGLIYLSQGQYVRLYNRINGTIYSLLGTSFKKNSIIRLGGTYAI